MPNTTLQAVCNSFTALDVCGWTTIATLALPLRHVLHVHCIMSWFQLRRCTACCCHVWFMNALSFFRTISQSRSSSACLSPRPGHSDGHQQHGRRLGFRQLDLHRLPMHEAVALNSTVHLFCCKHETREPVNLSLLVCGADAAANGCLRKTVTWS